MAVVNFASYATYCGFFFFDEGIRQEYRDSHGPNSKVTVESSDVVFSIHSFVLSLVMVAQITYFGGYKARPISVFTKALSIGIVAMCGAYAVCVLLQYPGFLWIDFLYILAMVKLCKCMHLFHNKPLFVFLFFIRIYASSLCAVLTVTTYVPQLLLNYQH